MSKFERSDRFEAKDIRDEGKVIEVIGMSPTRDLTSRYVVRTEVHPKNPSAVGRTYTISERTLSRRYRKISR